MTVPFGPAFNSEFSTQFQPKKAPTSAPGSGEAFLAAMDQVVKEEAKRRTLVETADNDANANLSKNKILLEDGKNLKFPMDEDIMQELLETVKGKIGQLRQLKEELGL